MIEFSNQYIELDGRLLRCRTTLGDEKFEEVYFSTGDAQLDIKFINRMLENGKRKIVGMREQHKPFSKSNILADSSVATFHRFGHKPPLKIRDVIFNDPATIVFWTDGTKTVVKAENEPYDREKGLAMAIAKKFLGNKGNYFETFKKYIKEDLI